MKANTRKQAKRNQKEDRRQRIRATESLVNRSGVNPYKQLPNTEEVRNMLISLEAKETGQYSRKAVSYYEAAHAVVSELGGLPVEFATALSFYDTNSCCWCRGVVKPITDVMDSSFVTAKIFEILAGNLAQEKAGFNDDETTGDQKDLERT
jgi:hypothetical protein